MFLGGIIIVVIYMASLAANEKLFSFTQPPGGAFALALILLLFILDETLALKISSSFSFAGDVYSPYFSPILILTFGALFLAIVSAVNLIKLEEGPLVKRL